METAIAFSHGFLLALGLILPLGVQNVFIFNQGACQKKLILALPAVAAAGASDSLLILLAVGGVSVAVLNFYWLKIALLISGIAFLAYMGLATWRNDGAGRLGEGETADWPAKKQIVFALSVSLLNPHAVMDTIGVIGTSSLSYGGSAHTAFTLACILVSWLWFIFLAVVGRLVRVMDSSGRLFRVINRVSAAIMWGSAVYLLYILLQGN